MVKVLRCGGVKDVSVWVWGRKGCGCVGVGA